MNRGRRRSTAEVFAEAMSKAAPAYPCGEVLPDGDYVNAWDAAWSLRERRAEGSVDLSKAGGR